MLDPEDGTLPLDSLFFERPIIHKVKPLRQEQGDWKDSYERSKTSLPPLRREDWINNLPKQRGDVVNCSVTDESPGQDGSFLWTQDLLGRAGNDTDQPRDSDHLYTGSPFPSVFNQNSGERSQFRRSLFKPPPRMVSESGDHGNSAPSQRTFQTSACFNGQVSKETEDPFITSTHIAPSPLTGSGLRRACNPPALKHNTGTKKAHILPLTPRPLNIQGGSGSGILRPVTEISAQFRSVFKEFPFFNYVQSKALDDILYTGKNFVACAPTGSGKTVLFELAIVRLLMETPSPWRNIKIVYMAPIKALCSQRYENWKQKFGPLGLNCKELTGDTEIEDFFEIQDAHLIMTTPEKWDSMTRKWRDNCLVQLVRLFLIDEVHVVKDTTRGATLEVVVSRMKTMHTYRSAENPDPSLAMRFVVVSATIPNIADIADWLSDGTGPATCLEMDESFRPVKLRKVVLGFPCSSGQNDFKFDLSLNYKMANVIQTYSDEKPTLVFCSTRKGVQQSAAVLAKDARFIMSAEHKQRLMKYANSLHDSKLRDLVMYGVGFHHAGVDMSDRKTIEDAFTLGDLPVLFTTSTLAMGVNLPAHLVVIKSTTHYVGGSCEEYSETDILQMTGRAGRPQFDTTATAVIMTRSQTKDKYSRLMSGAETIESSLHTHLVEHLNAEIVLHTISDVNVALDWIRSTFLYIRALKNPGHYGFPPDLDRAGIEMKLQELCLKNLNELAAIGLITMDEDVNFKPTEAGKLMARYYIAFETMKQFSLLCGTETQPELLQLISKSKEFSDIQLRVNEKRTLNTLNKDKNRITIRYPMEGKIKNNEMKVNCLIQAQLGSIPVQEFGLSQDTGKIFRIGIRISKCLSEFLKQLPKKSFSALLNSLILAKCFRARLWENSPFVSKQLEKIGLTLSTAMVNAGLTTFLKIEQTNARELEMIVNRHPPFGNQIKEAVVHLPKYEVSLEQIPRYNVATAEILVTVNLKNYEQLMSKRTAPDHHYVTLIIGDCDNNVVFLQNITDSLLLKSGSWSRKIEVTRSPKGEELSVNLISSEFVGLDIQQKYSAFYSGAKRFASEMDSWENRQSSAKREQGAEQRTQTAAGRQEHGKAPRAESAIQKAQGIAQRPNAKPLTAGPLGNDSSKENMSVEQGKRECNHFCKNKEQCGHDCCKVGVHMVLKRPSNAESGFSSYLRDLKNRNETLVQTPVKRLKMKMCSQARAAAMHQFSYKPKDILPAVPRCEGNQYFHPTTEENVDYFEDSETPRQISGGSYYDDYSSYLEDMTEEEAPVQAASEPQNVPVWRRSDAGNKGTFSSTVTGQSCGSFGKRSTHHSKDSSCFSPDDLSVTFDLGVDDWDDIDDVNLVNASEISYTKIPTSDCNTQRDYSTPLTSYEQPKSIFAQLSRSHTVSSTDVRPRESQCLGHIPNKQPLDNWSQSDDGLKTFNEMNAYRMSPSFPKQKSSHSATLNRTLNFFSRPNAVERNENSGRLQGKEDSSDVEAFLGIFEGIF
ncbi:probable ATP-dependent DNA helicase HFM1 isoform X1 [Anguilla anguilla]|uniref:probable ATP-dependent DNA helicase HFM1 isoform X1 n=2 Tax=Anguilla anguilla TaxID=7936 RepID=UPI0015ABC441|nr:probable ATP-dependent DNA helicase HFM1 isoform X1 [Anguilla anguilla]